MYKYIDMSLRQYVAPCADAFYVYIFSNTQEEQFVHSLRNLLSCFNGDTLCEQKVLRKTDILREYLFEDASSLASFDPAATSLQEVLLCYPAMYAIAIFRMAHILYTLNEPLVARMLTEHAHSKTAIDIHPGATIGRRFFLDHGTGVVIGESTVIKDNVSLYQGVTLGAKRVEKALKGVKRHPTVEENVIIYSNATILGGDTVIGKDSIINGNVFLTESVPPNSIVYALHDIKIKNKG